MERLIYRSRALWPAPEAALDAILATSMPTNAGLSVTGVLGFTGRTYVQLLEGPAGALDLLLGRLRADPRHTDLTLLMRAPVVSRLVPGWTMARVDLAEPAPRVEALLRANDGLALAVLMANLAHQGATGVA